MKPGPAAQKTTERIVEFHAAYDLRDSNPAKNGGIHGVEIRFVLKGPSGAVQFLIGTDWYLPSIQSEIDAKDRAFRLVNPSLYLLRPNGYDVGYHSPRPQYKGHEAISEKCPYIPGNGGCYYDGSGLRADEWVRDILLPHGSDGVWKALEAEYRAVFGRRRRK